MDLWTDGRTPRYNSTSKSPYFHHLQQVCFLTTLADHHAPATSDLEYTRKWLIQCTAMPQTANRRRSFPNKMKASLVFLLVVCSLCRTEAEGSENELVLQTDVWAELRALRDMVVEQKGELRHLASRVTAAESLVDALEKENTGKP